MESKPYGMIKFLSALEMNISNDFFLGNHLSGLLHYFLDKSFSYITDPFSFYQATYLSGLGAKGADRYSGGLDSKDKTQNVLR